MFFVCFHIRLHIVGNMDQKLCFQNMRRLLAGVYGIYIESRIPIAAAGLAFFLTLTFFPLLICLQTMLGSMFPSSEELRSMLTMLLPADTVATIQDYLRYAAANRSDTMLAMALTVVASSSAAAFRVMDRVMGGMRGGRRFPGTAGLVFSFCFSLLFLAAIYLSVILIGTGRWFLDYADRHIFFMNISDSWRWWRFVLLFLLLFMLLCGVYRITALRSRSCRLLPGAVFGSAALVAVSAVFSVFIGASAKYPLVYGSLAGVIVIMLWLYACGVILFLGCALNVALE